jgi:hypothetical protein
MSNTPRTIGIATIEVTSATTVDVTQRVISAAGLVVWLVENSDSSPHKVCVTNFHPVFPANGNFNRTYLLQQDDCTGNIGPGGFGVIVASFEGNSGQIITYDVKVDNAVAADPELEI